MNRSKGKRGNRAGRDRGNNRASMASVDRSIIDSAKATGSTTNVVSSDLLLKKQNFNIVESPPRSLGNQTFWCKESYDSSLNISSSTITEFNIVTAGVNFSGFSSAQGFFDQYCIYSLTFTFTSNLVAGYSVRLMTAIDYDNVANIGVVGIQAYSSFNETVLGGNGADSLVRFLKPCIAPQVTSSNLPVAGGISRSWLDIAYASVQHYGLRTIIPVAAVSQVGAINLTITAVFGFRNNQ